MVFSPSDIGQDFIVRELEFPSDLLGGKLLSLDPDRVGILWSNPLGINNLVVSTQANNVIGTGLLIPVGGTLNLWFKDVGPLVCLEWYLIASVGLPRLFSVFETVYKPHR